MKKCLVILFLFITTFSYAGLNDDLIKAAENGDIELVKSLVSEGADIEVKNNTGSSALDIALENEYNNIASYIRSILGND